MSELYVEYAVMDSAAESQRSAKDQVKNVEQMRADAPIPAGSLGTILPAEEIQTSFDEATNETREALADAAESCEALADGIDLVKRLFIATDANVAERFDAMAGGS